MYALRPEGLLKTVPVHAKHVMGIGSKAYLRLKDEVKQRVE